MDPVFKNLLYSSFDKELNAEEKSGLEAALIENGALRQEKELLKEIRNSVRRTSVKSFSTGFVNRVIQRLNEPEKNFDFFVYKLFKPLAVAASFLIVALLSYNISTADQLTLENILAVPDISLSETADLVYLANQPE